MARILLIDDDELVHPMLGKMLAHFGHTVIEARNGKEGIEVVMELRKLHAPVKITAISGG